MNSKPLVALALMLAGLAPTARAETDPGFLLSAGAQDWSNYFPPYLANGYVSSLAAPRGTEGNLAYMVAFMDYAQQDISRPAAIPGWTEIDYQTDASRAGAPWLNRAPLDAAHFKDYRQTLDLRAGTLATNYRYSDGSRQTGIQVVTFVSQAAPHLSVSQLTITPDFDGTVQLSFAFNLWAPHQPRFPLGTLSGPELEETLAANGLKIEPVAPATPDRAAIWYHGDTHVLAAAGDTKNLTLWLDGKAEQGLAMAQASAIDLPAGLAPQAVTLYQSPYRLSLNVTVQVEKDKTYSFTKFVAHSRAGWGGDAADDLRLATAARVKGFARLKSENDDAWAALWQSDIVIEGDARAQLAAHSELYYLLASSTADTAWPMGACALTPGYSGHTFWDSDTWIFPALLMLHPERAKSLVMFRDRTLPAAQARALERGHRGAMYPWESDPENGSEQTPHFAGVLGEREIHVNADVAIAQWQYYLATLDRDWLRLHGWPVIRSVADFWVSRASYNAQLRRYDIAHVTSVDEDYNDVPNDTFTNAAAAKALRIATAAALVVGARPDPRWRDVAERLHIPFSTSGQHHLDFDEAVPHGSDSWGGSSVPMLLLPSVDLPMSAQVRRNDYEYARRVLAESQRDANSMGLAPASITAAAAGDSSAAIEWFQKNFTGGTLKPPFNVRTETARNNAGYFVTAAGGLVQNLVYGFTGLRIEDSGLVEAYPPLLPPEWTSLTLRNVAFRGQHLDVHVAREPDGDVVLTRVPRSMPAAVIPDSPQVLFGDLYAAVQNAQVFADSKAFADAVPLASPADILARYREAKPASTEALRAFVEKYFALPPQSGAAIETSERVAIASHIDMLWDQLARSTTTAPPHSSLLPLPEPYVVPGGRFRELYYWDSYFTMLGLVASGRGDLAEGMVRDFAYLIDTYGHVPNGTRSYYLSRSQPPFFYAMVGLLTGDDPAASYARYLPQLQREYQFWMEGAEKLRRGEAHRRVVGMANGAVLNRYWDDLDTPRDESYREDTQLAGRSGRAPQQLYRDLRAAAESGWDFSSRWFADPKTLASIRTTEIVPSDLNSLLYGLENAISAGCTRAGHRACAREFDHRSAVRRAAVNRYLWDSGTGIYRDYCWTQRAQVPRISAAMLYPLYAALASQSQAAAVARTTARELLKGGGIAATPVVTGQQWDAPNGWAPLQWIAVAGLRRYAIFPLAQSIACRWMQSVNRVYGESGKLVEKYDVITTDRAGGGGEYPLQDGFGWTNGVMRKLMAIYSKDTGAGRVGPYSVTPRNADRQPRLSGGICGGTRQ